MAGKHREITSTNVGAVWFHRGHQKWFRNDDFILPQIVEFATMRDFMSNGCPGPCPRCGDRWCVMCDDFHQHPWTKKERNYHEWTKSLS